jgi:hypothetical protein
LLYIFGGLPGVPQIHPGRRFAATWAMYLRIDTIEHVLREAAMQSSGGRIHDA